MPIKIIGLICLRSPASCLNLPSDYQRPKEQTFEGKTVSFVLAAELSDGLKKLSAENNTGLFITTLALFNVLLSKYTKQNDITIGTPSANRGKQGNTGSDWFLFKHPGFAQSIG